MSLYSDLKRFPRFENKWSHLYIEYARIDRNQNALAIENVQEKIEVPIASIAVLMLGPGTTVTHEAVKVLSRNNCLVVWSGEENVRFYAAGMGGTRSAARLLHQAQLACNPDQRQLVARRMYQFRFDEHIPAETTIEQLRGKEGARVRNTYKILSEETGVPWEGRSYDRGNWRTADPVNRAISAGNSCLYGLCHAAILSAGYSPAIGFIHTGKQRSFVYDIADLYKTDIVLPVAFQVAKEEAEHPESATRRRLRDQFREHKLVKRIIPDIVALLGDKLSDGDSIYDVDPALPSQLWNPPVPEPDQEM